MKMKLLSPAGDFESLKMAVFYGADEVYLGVKDFNARNNIDGFDLIGLKRAVDFAHIYGVKVHLTVNILFSDEELQSAVNLIVAAYNLGVDAFIVQDIGLASLLHKNYPCIELHASTQMGLHNIEGVKVAQKLGFKRVVLARETQLSEIKRIKDNSQVEIEYFAQGALCVSFSGNCYLSSYLCDASGNRGKCKQLCRLPYSFEKDGRSLKEGYLLSAKDFCMLPRLSDLEKAGVDAIKIEGRARRAFYVAASTKQYRGVLDGLESDRDVLEVAFNRQYTEGYFNGNGEIISNFQNHIGIEIGKIEKVNYGKKFDEVFIRSKRKLTEKSTFKIFENGKEKSVLTAYDLRELANGYYRITTTQKVKPGDVVHLISDNELEEKFLSKVVRRKVDIDIYAHKNQPIRANIKLQGIQFCIEGDKCQEALKQPLIEGDISKNFQKSEFFDAKVNCDLGFVFLTKQKLNEFRRQVFEKLEKEIVSKHRRNEKVIQLDKNHCLSCEQLTDFQIIEKTTENLRAKNIIYSPEVYVSEEIQKFKNRCESLGKKFYLDTPNFADESDVSFLQELIDKTKVAIVANNLYALSFDTEAVVGGGLNIFNKYSANFFGKKFFVAEGAVGPKVKFSYMTLRHCPMKTNLSASCEKCPYSDGYSYKLQNGKKLKLKRKKLSSCSFYLTD